MPRRQTDRRAGAVIRNDTAHCAPLPAAKHYLPRRLRGVAGNQQPVHCYRLVVDSNWSHSSINLRDILTKTSEIHISPTPVSFNPAALSDPVTTVTCRSKKKRERAAYLKMKPAWSHLHLRTPSPVATMCQCVSAWHNKRNRLWAVCML